MLEEEEVVLLKQVIQLETMVEMVLPYQLQAHQYPMLVEEEEVVILVGAHRMILD